MSESTSLESPGVRFPPPFVYAAGVLAGWALDRWVHRLPIVGCCAGAREAVGAAFVLAWLALFLSAAIAFRRARTTLIPNRAASAIVTTGPYRFTRNPMYVSLVALYVGVSAMLDSGWALVLLPLVVIAIDRRVIAREERYLASAFPAEYGAYAARVRRWI